MSRVKNALLGLSVGLAAAFSCADRAEAMGRVTVGPYASVSSTKSIKPNINKSANDEVVTQRTTYGLRIGIRLSRLFSLGIDGGVNAVDTTKKASVMRDEYGQIDFEKDLNVDPSQGSDYRYQEEQRLAKAQLMFQPLMFRILSLKIGAGVRARQRIIKVTDTVDTTKSGSVTDPIRYQATASAALNIRLFRALYANIEYDFYFVKFPKTQPHEQEVSVGFGAQL